MRRGASTINSMMSTKTKKKKTMTKTIRADRKHPNAAEHANPSSTGSATSSTLQSNEQT